MKVWKCGVFLQNCLVSCKGSNVGQHCCDHSQLLALLISGVFCHTSKMSTWHHILAEIFYWPLSTLLTRPNTVVTCTPSNLWVDESIPLCINSRLTKDNCVILCQLQHIWNLYNAYMEPTWKSLALHSDTDLIFYLYCSFCPHPHISQCHTTSSSGLWFSVVYILYRDLHLIYITYTSAMVNLN